MDPDRKARKDSMLDSLPAGRKEQLRDGLLGGWGHEECIAWLATECGLVTKSKSKLTNFYKRHCAPLVRERRKLSATKSEVYVKDAGRTDWDAATKELVSQVTFEMLDGQRTDPVIAEKFLKLMLKKEAQEQSRDKINAARQSKIDSGLDAMFSEIKGNAKAEAAFKLLQEAINK
jgi:hypothetical protein